MYAVQSSPELHLSGEGRILELEHGCPNWFCRGRIGQDNMSHSSMLFAITQRRCACDLFKGFVKMSSMLESDLLCDKLNPLLC